MQLSFAEIHVPSVWEENSFKAAVFGAIATFALGIATGIWGVIVWRKDYRWKQAELARKLLDELYEYERSNAAVELIDGTTHFVTSEGKFRATRGDMQEALAMEITTEGEKRLRVYADEQQHPHLVFIRKCFDGLFYYLERFEQSCEIKVVVFEDLRASTSYCVKLMAKDKKLFEDYAKFIHYHRAVTFLRRFPEWW
jgi:hypothetical protein